MSEILKGDTCPSPQQPLSVQGGSGYETYVIDQNTIGVRPKWVSVRDRLPEKYSRVLISNGKGICIGDRQSNFSGDIYCSRYCDNCNAGGGNEETVKFWMPLPNLHEETCE